MVRLRGEYKMDLNKLTKQELIDKVNTLVANEKALQREVEHLTGKLNSVDTLIKDKDNAIKNEYEANKKVRTLEQTIESNSESFRKGLKEKDEELKFVKDRFDSLASLFDEYIKAFEDQHLLFRTMSRTVDYAKKELERKIIHFNNPQQVIEEGDKK